MQRLTFPISIAAAALAATALTACQSGGGSSTDSSPVSTSPAASTTTSSSPVVTRSPKTTPLNTPPLGSPATATSTAPSGARSTPAAPGTGSPAAGATRVVVVRPVTASGQPVAGYTVTNEGMQVACDEDSLSAADDGIAMCGASAAYLPACWKSTDRTVLCLRDATKKVLVRETYTGTWGARKKPAVPTPLDLRLADADKCQVRVGGAWGQIPQHPSWLGFASCGRGDVYGPPDGDGVNRTTSPWTVHLYDESTRALSTQDVATAYLVGTAS